MRLFRMCGIFVISLSISSLSYTYEATSYQQSPQHIVTTFAQLDAADHAIVRKVCNNEQLDHDEQMRWATLWSYISSELGLQEDELKQIYMLYSAAREPRPDALVVPGLDDTASASEQRVITVDRLVNPNSNSVRIDNILDVDKITSSEQNTINIENNIDLGNKNIITTGTISAALSAGSISSSGDVAVTYNDDGMNGATEGFEVRNNTTTLLRIDNSGLRVDGIPIEANGNNITGASNIGTTSVTASGNVSAGSVTTNTVNTSSGNLSLNPAGSDVNFNGSNITNAGTLSAGATTLSGGLDVGGNNITNVGTVDGVDVDAHGARHAPDGPDAVPTGVVGDIQNVTDGSASAGNANSFARSDHEHPHGNLGGGALHDTATTSIAGFMSASDKTKLDNQVSNPTSTFVEETGDTMTGALTMDNANIDMTNGANLAMNENAINSVNNINAGSTSNTINLRNNGGTNVLTVDGATPAIDANGNNVSAGSVTTSTVDTSSGNLSLNPAGSDVNFNSKNITNVSEITATTASVGTLDNDGSDVSIADNLAMNENAITGVNNIDAGSTSNTINLRNASGTNVLTVDGATPAIDANGNNVSAGSVTTNTVDTSSGNLSLNPAGSDVNFNSKNITNVSEITATTASVGTLDNDGSDVSIADNLAMNENAINGVNNIDAGSTSNTINLRNSGGTNVLTVDGATPAIDANGNDLLNVSTVTAANNNLTLDIGNEPQTIALNVVDQFTGGNLKRSVFGSDGFLYAGSDSNEVFKVNPTDMSEVTADGSPFTGASDNVVSVAFGSDGFLYAGTLADEVFKINPTNMSQAGLISGAPINGSARALSFGADGFLYVGTIADEVHKIDPADMSEVAADGSPFDAGEGVLSLSFGSDGFLYAGTNGQEVRKIDPTNMSEVTADGSPFNAGGSVLSLSFGSDGFLYAGTAGAGSVIST